MVKTASALKKSRGISASLGRDGVGITMPKSFAFPSKRGWTVKVSTFSWGSKLWNANSSPYHGQAPASSQGVTSIPSLRREPPWGGNLTLTDAEEVVRPG